jgi:O-methyltransferase
MLTAQELWSLAASNTMVGTGRMQDVIKYATHIATSEIPGDFVECGTWKGGLAMLMLAVIRTFDLEKSLYIYDTFTGMTQPSPVDVSIDGTIATVEFTKHFELETGNADWCKAGIDLVSNNLRSVDPTFLRHVKLISGKVEETLEYEKNIPNAIALLRLDTDWYESTLVELRKLWGRVVSRGIIIVDDYHYWNGQKQAVDEFLQTIDEREYLTENGADFSLIITKISSASQKRLDLSLAPALIKKSSVLVPPNLWHDKTVPIDYDPPIEEIQKAKTLTELADAFGTDKGTVGVGHKYSHVYEKIIKRNAVLNILEIGVACGASLKMWSTWLPNSTIYGIDIREECRFVCRNWPNIKISVNEPEPFGAETKFDIIIDDGSHISEDIVETFIIMYPRLNLGGKYIIEDCSCTYNDEYRDAHNQMFRANKKNDRKTLINLIDIIMRVSDTTNGGVRLEYSNELLTISKTSQMTEREIRSILKS